jgi:hypothetical protein
MKKVLMTLAVMAFFSGQAMADNYNNTNYTVAAEGEVFGLSIGTGNSKDFADNAQVIDLHSNSLPVNVGVQMIDDNTNQDWRLYATKTFEAPGTVGPVAYATPKVNFTKGDSYAKEELRIAPVVGVKYKGLSKVTPFAQVGYDWKSTKGDYLDFNRADSNATVGAVFAVSDKADLTVALNQEMDKEFNQTDREMAVKFSVKF